MKTAPGKIKKDIGRGKSCRKDMETVNCNRCGKEVLLDNGNGRCECGFEYVTLPGVEIPIYVDPDDSSEKIGCMICLKLTDEMEKLGLLSKEESNELNKEMKKKYPNYFD